MKKIAIVHGPNLNILGWREPEIYGHQTMEHINTKLKIMADEKQVKSTFFQSNSEGELIAYFQMLIQDAEPTHFIIFNPAAFTHSSIALRDTLQAVSIPFIEVHLSNIHAREVFRHHSYFSDIAQGVISGLGALGYELALLAALHYLNSKGV
ncbi:MAG: 3-dehydroquinate dehydratase [uncultured bacterium]|nr:MAG: 3-dehydroquinate dehydratase [uncultured bacterium]OGT15487.1 MAG: type II 3-dehydroquinate dehydratase [Gammaproteobacteria bacterium RIFCSPHIGHO2_02_FULL_38_33]OGT23841.1 MAG: type II 3-dehydroquinate dehydratase [Gammaproteobacteria bacterium RIFCSPHIGHO2_12_38_15]OGT69152.1 MAG: type II 3-dehydroquinate dehydratase [Gammaproteobacteria bacterium RIFCSPLOWO2_02_FULL_38_11]OGT77290.1 MAG: type II 3-dehydroquinate dehydratase [Gammaproteobacteria bacterium RIFCSPLOWO2_12_FULL_38_14]